MKGRKINPSPFSLRRLAKGSCPFWNGPLKFKFRKTKNSTSSELSPESHQAEQTAAQQEDGARLGNSSRFQGIYVLSQLSGIPLVTAVIQEEGLLPIFPDPSLVAENTSNRIGPETEDDPVAKIPGIITCHIKRHQCIDIDEFLECTIAESICDFECVDIRDRFNVRVGPH